MAYRLHAIDITSGTEPYGPGVLITGSYSGVVLNPPYVLQRMSLVIVNGQVIFGFSGAKQVEKPLNYDGWVMAYGEDDPATDRCFCAGDHRQLAGRNLAVRPSAGRRQLGLRLRVHGQYGDAAAGTA